jgi:hypothetical protein
MILRNYKSELSNLTLQENRLRRLLEKLTAEFKALRAEREALALLRRNQAADTLLFRPALFDTEFGFEFSREYLRAREAVKTGGGANIVALWDRTWKDKSAKSPS